jgi:hypothetical protein
MECHRARGRFDRELAVMMDDEVQTAALDGRASSVWRWNGESVNRKVDAQRASEAWTQPARQAFAKAKPARFRGCAHIQGRPQVLDVAATTATSWLLATTAIAAIAGKRFSIEATNANQPWGRTLRCGANVVSQKWRHRGISTI